MENSTIKMHILFTTQTLVNKRLTLLNYLMSWHLVRINREQWAANNTESLSFDARLFVLFSGVLFSVKLQYRKRKKPESIQFRYRFKCDYLLCDVSRLTAISRYAVKIHGFDTFRLKLRLRWITTIQLK